MIRGFFKFILNNILGFKITGIDPNQYPKKIYAIMPHTSNWDWPLAMVIKIAIKLDVQYFAKHSLFRWPYAWFFKLTGGIPVNRSSSKNFVDATVESIKKYDKISIALAPEGTRKRVDKLKTGFYWIARKANIPLLLVSFDYKNKVINFAPPFEMSDDSDVDMERILAHFRGVVGKIPENSSTLYL
jgi:1-acyl-sn-glycerol-3-phosphate acyltransferase